MPAELEQRRTTLQHLDRLPWHVRAARRRGHPLPSLARAGRPSRPRAASTSARAQLHFWLFVRRKQLGCRRLPQRWQRT